MTGRQTLKTIHIGAPWGARVRVEKVVYRARRSSGIAQDHLFEVSATWTGPDLTGNPDRRVSVRDCAVTRSHQRAIDAANLAAARLRAGQIPELPKLLPASRLTKAR